MGTRGGESPVRTPGLTSTGEESCVGAGRGGSTRQRAQFERSARFWLRAYPRRWRAARGEELLGVLLDLAAPGARRVGTRTALDLLRGGWATRWREHPPLLPWLGYRVLDRRLPQEYLAWAKDDIDGALHGARVFLSASWVFVFPALVFARSEGNLGDAVGATVKMALVLLAGVVLSALFAPGYRRRRAVLQHLAPRPGDQLYEGRLVVQDGPRTRVEARSGLAWTAAVAAVLAVASAVSVTLAPLGTWWRPIPAGPETSAGFATGIGPVVDRAPAVAVLALGLALVVPAVRRVRRWIPLRVEQPHRRLRRVGLVGAVRVLILTALGLAALTAEATGALALGIGPVLGACMLVLLAASLAGLHECRRPGAVPFAAVDVVRVLVHRAPPEADGPLPVLAPLRGPVPNGVVVPPHVLGGPRHPVLPV